MNYTIFAAILGADLILNATFNEITELAKPCRFSDCSHISEPGCAVLSAVSNQQLSQRRLLSYQKLMREQALNGHYIS